MKKLIKRILVEPLPANWRLAFYRNYFYRCKGDYVKPEVDLFQKLSDPAKTTLDIGANDGTYSMYLCRFAAQLVCFEPLPWLGDSMKKKFCDTQNVRIESCALGSKNETATIRIPVTKGRRYDTRSSLAGNFDGQLINGEKVLEVKDLSVAVKTLDGFQLNNVGFIKMDVEGFELEAIKGGRETILRNRPTMFIEIEQKHHTDMPIANIFQYILDLGYTGHFEFAGRFLPVEQFDPARHQALTQDGVKNSYCGNFVFLPKDISAERKSAILGNI
ncbi:MAG TPA: FkbM family methyltransferase [Verrucomicrobiae bacterium]|nr:FkbM family methyltransferase [Verrucomicrobiae bacterium]